jgi:hypothetical protein
LLQYEPFCAKEENHRGCAPAQAVMAILDG